MKNCIIASTSTIYGSQPLEYLDQELTALYNNIDTITFIPYASPGGITHDQYTDIVSKAFERIGKKAIGLHTFTNPIEGLQQAQAIFTGGGNTFLLVDQLYRQQIVATLQKCISSGIPYLGTSAGSNICGLTMQTTNDMPIIYPPSFKTLGILPFNINPHYLDPDPNSKHKGETRETRIKEFHHMNTPPVIGLREGSWLRLENNDITLKGPLTARIFEQGKNPYEVPSESLLNNLN